MTISRLRLRADVAAGQGYARPFRPVGPSAIAARGPIPATLAENSALCGQKSSENEGFWGVDRMGSKL